MSIRKYHKGLIVFISIVIILAILITIFYISNKPIEYTTKNTIAIDKSPTIENAPLWEHKGIIVHQVEDWRDFWGLELSFWERPFGSRRLQIKYLPEEFQIEGLKVKVKYGKADVVGSNDWDVIIDIIDIKKI